MEGFGELQPCNNCLNRVTGDLNHHIVHHMMVFLQLMVLMIIYPTCILGRFTTYHLGSNENTAIQEYLLVFNHLVFDCHSNNR